MTGFWDRVEDLTRDVLVALTEPLPEPYDGLVFGIALVITDHIYRPFKAVIA